jgi:hypothetical protein
VNDDEKKHTDHVLEECAKKVVLPGFESMPDAYQAFCELCASPEYQEMLAKKRKSGELTGTHVFEADGYICMGQRMINPHI